MHRPHRRRWFICVRRNDYKWIVVVLQSQTCITSDSTTCNRLFCYWFHYTETKTVIFQDWREGELQVFHDCESLYPVQARHHVFSVVCVLSGCSGAADSESLRRSRGAAGFLSGALDGASISSALHHLLANATALGLSKCHLQPTSLPSLWEVSFFFLF